MEFLIVPGKDTSVRRPTTTLALMTLLLLAAIGCEVKTGPTAAAPTTAAGAAAAKLAPRELLNRTIEAYRAATAYEDHGQVRLSYKQDGRRLEDAAPLAVAYAAPNRLAVEAYQTRVASDGEHFTALIRDPDSNDIDGQVVRRPSPEKLALDELYADTVLHKALESGLGRHPVQLELLFGSAPLLDLIKPETPLAMLEPATIQDATEPAGHACARLEATLADGVYVFWIDQESYLLRRIDYPAEAIVPDLVGAPGVSEVKLVADFRRARFNAPPPAETFALEAPAGSVPVRYFVLPPQALPSQLFGKQPSKFKFTTVAGEPLAQADLQGQPTVLMWFTADPANAPALQQLQAAMATIQESAQTTAYVIATEDQTLPSEKIAEMLREWNVNTPLLRDFDLAGRDVFAVRNAPTLVVLDAAGRVQIFQEGVNPQLAQTLPVIIERLLAGDDLAAEILADADKAQQQYAQDLATASDLTVQTSIVELNEPQLAPAREPAHFTKTPLWTISTSDVVEPANFLIVDSGEETDSRVLVMDGWRKVVELDAQGQVAARHTLDVPEVGGVSFLRTAIDGTGKRYFVGSALLGRQLYLFDDAWQTKMRYPPDDQEHEGIHAVEIADLADDGTPELYVGYWSLHGVQGVSLAGKREWSNRVIPTVLSLVVSPKNEVGWQKILATSDRGSLYRLNQYGHLDPKIEVSNRQIHRLTAAKFGGTAATSYCGISYQEDGRLLAIGLDAELGEVWNYTLPPGQFNTQIEHVTSGRLRSDESAEWVLAGPDGSVHVVSADGEFRDSFAVGELLTGLAVAKLGEQRVVLTATKTGITAWALAPK
jgi:hypothetical protein